MSKLMEDLYVMYEKSIESVIDASNSALAVVVEEKEEMLRPFITDKGTEAFKAYVKAWHDLERSYSKYDFANGFRMGARLMLEILNDDSIKSEKKSDDAKK